MKNIKKKLQTYCDRINEILDNGGYDEVYMIVNQVLKDMKKSNPYVDLYYSRSVFINNGFDNDKIMSNVYNDGSKYKFVVSDDLTEHQGIVIRYSNEDKESEW